MPGFEVLFPTFVAKCGELRTLLLTVAFLLFTTGTILLIRDRFTARTLLLHLVRLVVLTSLLIMLPTWGNQVQELLQDSILDGLGVDPQDVHEQYQALVVARRDLGTGNAWWDLLGHLTSFSLESLITAVLWIFGYFASLLLFWAYLIQKIILFIAYALSPLLIGMMGIPALRSIGSRFLMNLVGVLLWPLGWGVAALVTQGILDFMTDPSLKFIDPTSTGYHLQTMVGLGVLAFWVTFSTVAAPAIIQKVFATGALAGAELLSHTTGGFLQTAATTAGAAAVASGTGLPLVTAGAAGMAAMLSSISTAAGHGSAGAIIIAGSGLPPRSTRGRPGDDITGDSAVRDLIAKSKNHYF